jgi:hypothetical protein
MLRQTATAEVANWVDGKAGDDQLFGGMGNDLIEGDQGADTLVGGGGDDTLKGGHDTDTAIYAHDAAGEVSSDPGDYYSVIGYDIVIGADGTTITDIDGSDGDTGADTLVDMEQAVFSDGDADGDGTADLITVFLDGQNNVVLAVADDPAATNEDTPIVFQAADLIGNDIEFDGDIKQLISVQDAVNGTVSLAPDGTVTFTPATNFSGEASFTYTVSDGRGGTDTQIVNIDIAAVADAPALDLNAALSGDQTVGGAVGNKDSAIALDVSASVTDGSESLTALVVSAIPDGAILTDGVFTFQATALDGDVDILGWNLAALTITPPAGSDTDFQLQVTATSTESVNGDMASAQGSIDVTVLGEVGAPTIDLGALAPSAGFKILGADPADQSGLLGRRLQRRRFR